MVYSLKNGKYLEDMATPAEVNMFVDDAKAMIEKYGWFNRTVYPYGYAESVEKIIDDIADYDKFTFSSKQYLLCLANGLADILNAWEEHENAPKVLVRSSSNGREVFVEKWMADELIADGLAEAI